MTEALRMALSHGAWATQRAARVLEALQTEMRQQGHPPEHLAAVLDGISIQAAEASAAIRRAARDTPPA